MWEASVTIAKTKAQVWKRQGPASTYLQLWLGGWLPSVSQLQAAQAAVADVLQAAVGTPWDRVWCCTAVGKLGRNTGMLGEIDDGKRDCINFF